jgi:predicted trehalose synthase
MTRQPLPKIAHSYPGAHGLIVEFEGEPSSCPGCERCSPAEPERDAVAFDYNKYVTGVMGEVV